jgi:hypothetical protein
MSLESYIKESVDEWADDAPPIAGMAGVALRGRRRVRRRRTATAVLAVAALAAVAIPTTLNELSSNNLQAGADGTSSARSVVQPVSWTPLPLSHPHSGNVTVSAHPSESPPVHFIAADDAAVSAYNFQSTTSRMTTYTWYLYDPSTGTYKKTPWAQLDVSPGLGLAAVLEGPAATHRIGIVDMKTGTLIRWITTRYAVGTVTFSPDGTKLLGTLYSNDPRLGHGNGRNGFVVIDLVHGVQIYGNLPAIASTVDYPYDGVQWTYNGRYFYIPVPQAGAVVSFFNPDGTRAPEPANATALTFESGYGATVSPDGTKAATSSQQSHAGSITNHQLPIGTGSMRAPQTEVADLASGTTQWRQPVEQLDAWANNSALIADQCSGSCSNESNSRLVLVNLDGTAIVPLTGTMTGTSDISAGQWRALLTQR